MISVTGTELLRACLDDRFRRILASLFAQPLGAARAATKGLLAFVGSVRNAPGLGEELLLVPVVVDVGAIETLDHFGGATAGFGGLEDAEGDQGAAPSSFKRSVSTKRVTWARALERWKGLTRTSQMSVHRPTWRVGVVVCHVAPVPMSASSKEMPRMRALQKHTL